MRGFKPGSGGWQAWRLRFAWRRLLREVGKASGFYALMAALGLEPPPIPKD